MDAVHADAVLHRQRTMTGAIAGEVAAAAVGIAVCCCCLATGQKPVECCFLYFHHHHAAAASSAVGSLTLVLAAAAVGTRWSQAALGSQVDQMLLLVSWGSRAVVGALQQSAAHLAAAAPGSPAAAACQ